ncbi:MAG: LacI family DNA-binding transcriptional regulator [Aeromonas sp.]|jgi:transcriptional regulator with XRE-family HTH domain|uniref:LacI family DNA-binding transcriptional regulator n=1 Tax=Aeromonas media TaxID=651 RepID=A0AAE6SKF7_AERME|nr:LacI family DNA-binding transcriptional regulator [Aeromonas sp.]QHQ52333.1 LacI family DNA-binding transcriptional regulator [Aeromonas media]MBP8112670.1 LacI family DNA-binding transcriptional regulator [Aeromonas sp.]MBP8152180.1 LacI family DNA-binding transcriptional regulator [Aeromonas sp.]MBP8160119.1 LacI family DNA-binding transcriptional regulator [Aeromonas sp.]
MDKQRITMSAIAAVAGVSQSTVSLVLNGSSAVKLSFRGNSGGRPTTYGWRDIARP